MKIIAFVGSPRKGSNVDTLINAVVKGIKSKTKAQVKKIYLYKAHIEYCNGCMLCSPLKGCKDCPLEDDMVEIYQRMQEADGFIFGTPNHGHTASAAMTNLLSRMQALLKMEVTKNEQGKIVSARAQPLIAGKKAVVVVSQGDFTPSTGGLLLRVMDSNMKDFHLAKVGEVFSTGNLYRAQVKDNAHDLKKAFELGVRMAEM
jgi:multimeric flavodoxin WrbA